MKQHPLGDQALNSNHAVFELREYDQAGEITTIYSQGQLSSSNKVVAHIPLAGQSYWKSFLDVFLPAGYPKSVTRDYLPYQIYVRNEVQEGHWKDAHSLPKQDSLQAFSSSIAGLLASRAVLEGIGVGDVSASPTAAVLLSILQESVGRIATIVFGARLGTSLEPECKMYRLLADIFNDAAMILDCLSPALPRIPRVFVLSFASALRALCGVAAGSSKASLSAHFATQGNLGELNAKDSSQETIISLFGMLAGSFVVTYITTSWMTWLSLMSLLFVHLFTNYLAVRSVAMQTLNRQRANIVFDYSMKSIINNDKQSAEQLDPETVALRERVFERDGAIRCNGFIVGYCSIGVPFSTILQCLRTTTIEHVLEVFKDEPYILWLDDRSRRVMIVLKVGADSRDQLRAWLHAFLICCYTESNQRASITESIQKTLKDAKAYWPIIEKGLLKKGWNLDIGALETRSGLRLNNAVNDKKSV